MMMGHAREIDWDDMKIAFPSFLTIVLMPLSYSIAYGVLTGILANITLWLFIGVIDMGRALWNRDGVNTPWTVRVCVSHRPTASRRLAVPSRFCGCRDSQAGSVSECFVCAIAAWQFGSLLAATFSTPCTAQQHTQRVCVYVDPHFFSMR
jgi:hypothetical protein